ncbi:MAG: SGNH/GDSL hydrolase family protein [Planktothrix sp. GU0601_MAG3]|nr:MAG: SGNH/GDSL hydrolase family protein [Planktothrix sp. GU0601_MAG3]
MINIYTTGRLLAVSVGTIAFTITGINAAQAAKFTSINIFGDSLSDPGNVFKASGGLFPPAPYDQGRFSNGPIWTDYLANDLGLNPIPYMDTNGIPSAKGVNYAFGGATSGADNIAYLFNDKLAGLPGVQTQVGALIQPLLKAGQTADPNSLYVLWAGGNDYTYGGSKDTGKVIDNLSWAIDNLYSIGARNFLIGNLPDLSQTPLGSSGVLVPPGDLQETVQAHNTLLNQKITDLNQSLFNSKIALFDVNKLFKDVINKPDQYGLTNVENECFSATSVSVFLCNNPDEYLFWDNLHPTTKGHKLIADAAYATIEKEFKSTPEPSTIFALTGIGLGFLLLNKNKKAA